MFIISICRYHCWVHGGARSFMRVALESADALHLGLSFDRHPPKLGAIAVGLFAGVCELSTLFAADVGLESGKNEQPFHALRKTCHHSRSAFAPAVRWMKWWPS